jgi:hypothetical protein
MVTKLHKLRKTRYHVQIVDNNAYVSNTPTTHFVHDFSVLVLCSFPTVKVLHILCKLQYIFFRSISGIFYTYVDVSEYFLYLIDNRLAVLLYYLVLVNSFVSEYFLYLLDNRLAVLLYYLVLVNV